MNPKVLAFMKEIFLQVKENRTCHDKLRKKLQKYYERVNFTDFCDAFIFCLKMPLTRDEKYAEIENVLEFASKFSVSLHNCDDENEESMCPFLTMVFNFLLEHHDVLSKPVRFRICYFVNMLLNAMGENAFIEDELYDKVTSCMTERLLDKAPKVRAQAVFALQRLQDPDDDNCPITKMFLFHLAKDPSSEVRLAILSTMGKTQQTLQAVLKRTRDINETVRQKAYLFISRITVRSLTMKQRETLVQDGLNDKSEVVSKVVRNVLLPAWLQYFEGQYTRLLRALDAELATETAVPALKALMKRAELSTLLDQLPVEAGTSLIPIEKLTSENALYWRCLVEHLYKESCTDHIDVCVPELSRFCDYIRKYLSTMGTSNKASVAVSEECILRQLFEITKTYDLADESGRSALTQLIVDTLQSDFSSVKITECIVRYFEHVVPDVDTRLNMLAHVISEIRMSTQDQLPTQIPEEETVRFRVKEAELKVKLMELEDEEYEMIKKRDFLKAQELKEEIEELMKEMEELSKNAPVPVVDQVCKEKDDPETMIKCLTIMCCMSCVISVKTLTPTLSSLLDNLALPSIEHVNLSVHILALKAVAICCLLDKEVAKKYIMHFFLHFGLELDNRDIWVICIKAIFDLLQEYGLEFFDIEQDEDDEAPETSERRRSKSVRLYNSTKEDITDWSLQSDKKNEGRNRFIKILISLMDNGDRQLRTMATEGFVRLILHRRIEANRLIPRLVILLYNPTSEDDGYKRQILITFFKTYVTEIPDSQEVLELAFLPTLKTLANAPDASPLHGIEPTHVAQFLLGLTSSRNHKPGRESYTVHNNLAMSILAEALDNNSVIDQETLLKSLSLLDIHFEDNCTKQTLRENADKIEATLGDSQKRLKNYLAVFKSKLEIPEETQQEIPPNDEAAPRGEEVDPNLEI